MKTKFLIITIASLMSLTSCDPLYDIFMVNNSNVPIYVAAPEFNGISVYPDTILPMDVDIYNVLAFQDRLESQDTNWFFEDIVPTSELFINHDTLSFFIFNADTVDLYSWDTVIKYNMVLQRYDFSCMDIKGLDKAWYSFGENILLYFPPSEDMKHIHMWPPYGTYDETGHGKK